MSISDTPYTIDTYSTFTMDGDEASIEDGKTYDDYEWEYDKKGYVQALAENWQKLMRENILNEVILNVTVTGPASSPREYNFKTDNAPIDIEYNAEKLSAYIEANRAKYDEEKRKSYDGYMWLGEEIDNMILWYLETVSAKVYTTDSYFMDQCDEVSEYEFIGSTLITK